MYVRVHMSTYCHILIVVSYILIYIDGKENAKMAGDRMKMLMLTLPFMVRDLIAQEVNSSLYILVYTLHI